MNRGSIPGFYYDEEKKKYFRIQPTHVAPEAKYSKSNVKRERREAKVRRLDRQHNAVHRIQRVQLSQTLYHPGLGSSTFGRELGNREPPQDLDSRDAALLFHLRPSRISMPIEHRDSYGPKPLEDAHLIPGKNTVLWASSFAADSHPVFQASFTSFADWDAHPLGNHDPPFTSFHSPVVSIMTGKDDGDAGRSLVICARRYSAHGNVHFGRLVPPKAVIRHGLRLNDPDIWATAMHPTTNRVAISATSGIWLVDEHARYQGKHALAHESKCVTWLDETIIACHHRLSETTTNERSGVGLCDIRVRDSVLRFPRSVPSRPLTGLANPDESGVHLLAADNYTLDLYDTRVTSKPLLSFKHVHQGPQLAFDTYAGSIVAAVDRDNRVQTYSLRTGKSLGMLPPHRHPGRGLITKLRFVEGLDGQPVVQACQDHTLVKWTYDDFERKGAWRDCEPE